MDNLRRKLNEIQNQSQEIEQPIQHEQQPNKSIVSSLETVIMDKQQLDPDTYQQGQGGQAENRGLSFKKN